MLSISHGGSNLVAHIEMWVIPNIVPIPDSMFHDPNQQPRIIYSSPSYPGPVDGLGPGHHPISAQGHNSIELSGHNSRSPESGSGD